MPRGEKIYVWCCLNRMENGRRICKCSPTFAEQDIHDATLDHESGAITEYDDARVRQLISNIKAVDKEILLIRFKDGTEITQRLENRKITN